MPEGPELFLASLYINSISKNRLYGGQVIKSEVSTKNPDVDWDYGAYRISAVARGKELKVTLMEGENESKNEKTMDILFRFGMSGSFKFTSVSDIPKHAHLRFFTIRENQPMVLSFVDYRRFGRWQVGADWSKDRGPDPMWEYPAFRENVLSNLKLAAFNRPICETMLNQKFFNGIGNYLRAEILYKCGIRPFDEARSVLSELKPISHWYNTKVELKSDIKIKIENDVHDQVEPDILDLCHILPKEVINLEGGGKGYNVDPDADEEEYAAFKAWLKCYYQDGMENLVDHNKRTIWFSGHPGKLVPKECSSRSKVKRKNQRDVDEETETVKPTVEKKKKANVKKRQDKQEKKNNVTPNKSENAKTKRTSKKTRKEMTEGNEMSSKTEIIVNGKTSTDSNLNKRTTVKGSRTLSKPKTGTKLSTSTPLRRSSRTMS